MYVYTQNNQEIYIFILLTVLGLLRDEGDNTRAVDALGGCRSGQNTVAGDYRKSGGLFTLFTLAGIMVTLQEVRHSESPTEVITRTAECMTSTRPTLEYFKRMLVCNGYDMMCNIVKRLLSKEMSRLISSCSVSRFVVFFWFMLGMHRLFVDKFHIGKHKERVCSTIVGEGVFHPNLSKFEGILNTLQYKVNEGQVEQFWVTMNKLSSIRRMQLEKHSFLLFLKREHHNHQRKMELEAKGYFWEPITNWKCLRQFEPDSIPADFCAGSLPSWTELQNGTKAEITDVERVEFRFNIAQVYSNVWDCSVEGQQWVLDRTSQKILGLIKARAKQLLKAKGNVSCVEIHTFLEGKLGLEVATNYRQYVNTYLLFKSSI